MASRLNEDDTQGQNKWADIDDDDDDWAPEAITWGDGTKTTLPHLDDQPGLVQESSPTPTAIRPRSPAPTTTSKPSAIRSSGLATGRGMILKSASQEKPSLLVAKVSAPTAPAKSPWAALPPVERASPGAIESMTAGQNQPRVGPPVKVLNNIQPKEIAADDFSRSSWRENINHNNKELFNSQSGRYEPVSDRRASFKSDPQNRPALLQRPTPTEQVGGTPNSQQFRVSQDGTAPRRRGSSNLSTGSGSFHPRASKSNDNLAQSTEPTRTRDASLTHSNDALSSAVTAPVSAPRAAADDDYQHAGGNVSSDETSLTPHSGGAGSEQRTPAPTNQFVDQVEYQKRLMRERIEMARKRRQEEEAQEEAARKERIQKKLEALGPPPERRSDKKDPSPKLKLLRPTQIQQRAKLITDDQHAQKIDKAEKIERASATTDESTDAATRPQTDSSQADPKTQPLSPSGSASPRKTSHSQESRRNDLWGGTGPRSDRFTSWGSAAPPPSRNVWGSPDNDRGLGNGTFNPDLGRVGNTAASAAQGSKGPMPIAPPGNAPRTTSQPLPQMSQVSPAGSQNTNFGPSSSDLASKWVASVAEKDQSLATARLAERIGRERHLVESGLTMEDSQPVIKDSWRPVHAPGDGTRFAVGSIEVQSHHPASWKSKDNASKASAEESSHSTGAGIIGSGAPSQSRPSRFFPARDARRETNTKSTLSRPLSPTPPPPTMEGHPVYEGDVLRPQVSLPKPQPVVRLPPTLLAQAIEERPQNVWTTRLAAKASQRDRINHGIDVAAADATPGNWQARFHRLLHGDKTSQARDIRIDAFSRGPLEHTDHQTFATVLLPNAASTQAIVPRQGLETKPMADECFEEQEMGSLPQIRLPHKAPEAAWHPAVAPAKTLPRKFLVQAAVMEPIQLSMNTADMEPASVIIHLPGMKEPKIIGLPRSLNQGSRPSSAHKLHSRRSYGSTSRGARRDSSAPHRSEANSSRGARGTRGGYRSRASDNWTRPSPLRSQAPPGSAS